MAENKFGKISRISITAGVDKDKTVIEDLSFTAPYKVMSPFPRPDGGISVMPLCASAGIMEGDRQEFSFHIKKDAKLEMLSQSFEKIHKIKEGNAFRHIEAQVDAGGCFYYYPQPVIPYKDSAFDSHMEIYLEDVSSRLFLMEVITCGRSASQERFAYRRFASRVEIYRNNRLIYLDNTCYEPEKMPMEGLGFYEGFTHMANIFLSRHAEKMQDAIWDILDKEPEIDGGVTRLSGGDLAVRILGRRSQKLEQIAEKIKDVFETGITD